MTLQLRPTFSESWYRVKDLQPRLRPTAQVSRQYYRGDRWYVVRDPAANQYHRLSDAAYRFVGLLDGSRTIGEAWELVGGQLADDAPTQPEVIQILSQLYAANLIETNLPPDATVLLRRHKKQQQQKMKQRAMNLLFPRIPLWDPDRFLKTWMPLVGPLISWFGAAIWLAICGFALFLCLPLWDELWAYGKDTINFSANPENAVMLGLSFVIIKAIHEMGHGFTCRRFGGEVHELGIMFLVLFPCPYVDASSAWSFSNKWKRVLVGAGGMIIELFVAALAAFIWVYTHNSAHQTIAQLAYNVMLIASVSTVIFNINPLLRYDGYYILSDLLEIPNLQFRSREYALGLFKRHVFRVKQSQPLPSPGARVWMVLYHYLSATYRIFVGFAIMLMVLYQLPEQVKIVGLIMGLGAMATFFIVPIFKLFKYLTVEPELHRKRIRAWAFCGACAAAIVFAVGIWGFPVAVRGQGIIEPLDRHTIYPGTVGFVDYVAVKDKDPVKKGDPLLVLFNDELQAEKVTIEKQLQSLAVRRATNREQNPEMVALDDQEIQVLQKRLERVNRDIDRLTIRAPIDGIFISPNVDQMAGRFVQLGDQIGFVANDDKLVSYAVITQSDVQTLTRANGAFTPEVRIAGNIKVPFEPTVYQLSPGPVSRVRDASLTIAGGGPLMPDQTDPSGLKVVDAPYEFRMEFANRPIEGATITPGQRVYVRIRLEEKEPLIFQGWRMLLQVIQTTKV